MSLADQVAVVAKPDDIICREWSGVAAGSRRCKHFLAEGPCVLETEFMCVEWMRAQGMFHQFTGYYTEADVQIGELHATARKLRLAKPAPPPAPQPAPVAETPPPAPPPAPQPAPVAETPPPAPPPPSKLAAALAKLKGIQGAPAAPAAPKQTTGLEEALARLLAIK